MAIVSEVLAWELGHFGHTHRFLFVMADAPILFAISSTNSLTGFLEYCDLRIFTDFIVCDADLKKFYLKANLFR